MPRKKKDAAHTLIISSITYNSKQAHGKDIIDALTCRDDTRLSEIFPKMGLSAETEPLVRVMAIVSEYIGQNYVALNQDCSQQKEAKADSGTYSKEKMPLRKKQRNDF